MLLLRHALRNAKGSLLSLNSTVSRRFQQNVFFITTKSMATISSKSGSTIRPSQEGFEEKSKRLKRPISPHLSVYKWRNNMILSMMHRFTGIALYGIPFGLAAVAILLPESYPYYIGILEEMHFKEFVLSTAKFLIAFPFSYHLLNGVRHLIWDVGYLWTIKEINISCYIVVVLALALAIHLTTL